MKNTFGNSISITLFGESHGEAIGCVIDGLTPGIEIDIDYINKCLSQRASRSDISTPRQEADGVKFLSGVKNGRATGTPLCLIIENQNKKSSAYDAILDTPRPSHADLCAEYKYHGYQDKAGGGHFSGRITAPIVAAGAIVRSALSRLGIEIGTHIKSLHGIYDRDFEDLSSDINALMNADFPTLSPLAEGFMKKKILLAKEEGDSVGGILESAIIGVPRGIGEPWFDTVEGMLSHALFSIPAVKGVEFGDGFSITNKLGSEANDPLRTDGEKIYAEKNSSGGIQGGITSGEPIIFRVAVKPTPSISKAQRTVNMTTLENTEITVGGRHDPAIVHRARAVVDAIAALTVADLLVTRFGTDVLLGGIPE